MEKENCWDSVIVCSFRENDFSCRKYKPEEVNLTSCQDKNKQDH